MKSTENSIESFVLRRNSIGYCVGADDAAMNEQTKVGMKEGVQRRYGTKRVHLVLEIKETFHSV